MRIVEVSQYFAPYRGGQEAYVLNLSRHLARSGDEVTVLTTCRDPQEQPALSVSPVEVIRNRAIMAPLNTPLSTAVMRHHRLLDSCDIIHVHNEHSFLTLTTMMMKMALRPPIVLTHHGRLDFGNRSMNFVERLYSRTIGEFVLRSADLVFANSVEDRVYLADHRVAHSHIVVASNGVDVDALSDDISPGSRDDIRELIGVPANSKLLLYVGRLIARKGIPILLRAAAHCLREREDLAVLIIGDGPFRDACEDLSNRDFASGRFRVIPNASDQLVHRAYQAADLVVLPSYSDVCPTVVLEALFYGCKVVASDIPGVRDHFSDLATLITPGSSETLANAILEYLGQVGEPPEIRAGWSAFVRERYSWSRVAQLYRSSFERILNETTQD